jgi:hypothetical protein
MLSNNMRSRLINILRLGKVGDGLSKLQEKKTICQSEIESIKKPHDFHASDFEIRRREISIAPDHL